MNNGYNNAQLNADVTSVGDGITLLGYKSSFARSIRCSCITFIVFAVILGLSTAGSIVLASFFKLWFVAVGVSIVWVIIVLGSIVSAYRRRDTEIYMNSQTKVLTLKSYRTPVCNCFGADEQNREFPLDQVQSIDQTPIEYCASRGWQVGLSVTLVTGETYYPIRPYFNRTDIVHLQEFLRNYKLGQIGAGIMPAAAIAAVAANANANARVIPIGLPPQGYGVVAYPPQGLPSVGVPPQGYYAAGAPPQVYYAAGAPPQGYYVAGPPPAGYSFGGAPPPDANTSQDYYGSAGNGSV